eukprot:CAMPEP_0118922894 /NCGR_PEP_ID=MMETSP1169-20130426/1644_1 /TAXON_ID=36882 /ORGANISM="Pyramimonas obovata, Strain CCMP722" /LENGTH=182 /DNA_ID=CAMNT_0006863823 /DNA_START=341 /DNA_END=889 /DNA_ORIENTATION=-
MHSTSRKVLSLACVLLLCFSTFFTSALAQDAPEAATAEGDAVSEKVVTADATEEGALEGDKEASADLEEKVEDQTGGEVVTEREAELLERLPDMTLDKEGMLSNNAFLRVMVYTAVAAMAFLVPVLIVHLIGKFFYNKVAAARAGVPGGVPSGLIKAAELERKLNAASTENEQLKSLLPTSV